LKKGLIGARRIAFSSTLSPETTGDRSLETAEWRQEFLNISEKIF